MRPTPRAIALRASLGNILHDIEQLVTEPIFIPALATGTLRITASDYATTVILPPILKHLSLCSPLIDIECYEWHSETLEKLKNGEIDLGLGIVDLDNNSGIRTPQYSPSSRACASLIATKLAPKQLSAIAVIL